MFRDAKLNSELLRNGFVITPFLNSDEIEEFERFYMDNPPEVTRTFHSTPISTDINYRRKVNDTIQRVFSRPLSSVFTSDYKYFFGSFTVKEPSSEDSEWDIHQDWTFVDERKFSSIGVWVPLVDVNDDNGCLSVVEKSHKFLNNIRGTNTFSEYANISNFIKDDYLTSVPMKAGDAVFFMNSLLHYSPPNFTDLPRVSVNCLMFPKQAQTFHFYRDKEWKINELEKFEITAETMITHNFLEAKKPKKAKSYGRFDLEVKSLSQEEFSSLYKLHNGGPITRSMEKIKRMILS